MAEGAEGQSPLRRTQRGTAGHSEAKTRHGGGSRDIYNQMRTRNSERVTDKSDGDVSE